MPHSGYDAVLFAALAIVLACVLQGKFFSLWIFVAGETTATGRCLQARHLLGIAAPEAGCSTQLHDGCSMIVLKPLLLAAPL